MSTEKSPPSRALLKRRFGGDAGGAAASLREAASPPDPLSRRVAGNRLDSSFGLVRPCEVGAVPCCLVVVTTADRAAATCLRGDGQGSIGSVGRPFSLSWLRKSRALLQMDFISNNAFHLFQIIFENLGTFSPLLRLTGCKAHETLSLQNEKR